MKYDRSKHVELVVVAGAALEQPAMLQATATLVSALPAQGVRAEHDSIGLRFFRDMTEEELAEQAETDRVMAAYRAERAAQR